VLDVPSFSQDHIDDPSIPLVITEGARKVDSVNSRNYCAIGVQGVWGWVGTNAKRGKTALIDWRSVALNGRTVYLAFDSDAMIKKEVHQALAQFKDFLESKEAKVNIVYLPEIDGLDKTGVDDFFVAGHTVDDLMKYAIRELKPMESEPDVAIKLPDDGRPTIQVDPTKITRTVDATLDALVTSGYEIYQRDGTIVAILRSLRKARHGLRDDAERLRIVQASTRYLQELATESAHYEVPSRFQEGSQYYRPGSCPENIINHIEARMGLPFPVLTGITTTPTIRDDGSILDQPGYDEATGLFYKPQCEYFPVPEAPRLEDAKTAIADLKEAFADFPFDQECHRSATLAACLSIVCRHMYRVAPLFAVTSNTRAAGKGLAVNVITLIATGEEPSKSSASRDDEEMRKQLLVIALDGDRTTVFDNYRGGTFGTPSLERVLTEPVIKDRILGKSASAEVMLQTVFFVTANNLQYAGDTARRVVPIALSPQVENPETRADFQHKDLLGWAKENHPRLLVAVLTIMRAYILAGKPAQSITPYGSFEEWSDLVRGALVWTGEPDPCEGRGAVEADADSGYESLRELLTSWEACYKPEARMYLKTIVSEIKKQLGSPHEGFEPNEKLIALGQALLAFDPKADGKLSALDALRLGRRLPVNNGRSRILENLTLRSERDNHTKTKNWWVEPYNGVVSF
jgi:hypothetical protein